MRPEGIPTTSESEDDEEEMDAYQQQQEKKMLFRKSNTKQMRISVSAEVYGEYNKKKDFKAPINAKPESTIQNIIGKLEKSFLFQHLEMKEKRVVALAMKRVDVNKGDFIIK